MPHNGLTWRQIKKRNREMAKALQAGTSTVQDLAATYNISESQVRKSVRKTRTRMPKVPNRNKELVTTIKAEIMLAKSRVADLEAALELLKDL